MEEMRHFGQRLTLLRQEAGLSQQALADRLSVTRQAVSNWEREQTMPDLAMLRAIAQVLETDLNTLCGTDSTAGAAPRHPRRRAWMAAALAVVLCGAFFCGGYWMHGAQGGADGQSQSGAAAANPPRPHTVQYTTPGGVTVRTAADGWQELTALLGALPGEDAGEVERPAELVDAACYFAGQYMLSYAPDYQNGQFSSWDETVFWLYKVGISRGDVMTRAQVDEAIAALFGAGARYTHAATARLLLTEEGYEPRDVATAGETRYALTALKRLEDGAYALTLQERTGGETILLTVAREGDAFYIRSLVHSAAA